MVKTWEVYHAGNDLIRIVDGLLDNAFETLESPDRFVTKKGREDIERYIDDSLRHGAHGSEFERVSARYRDFVKQEASRRVQL